MTESELAIRRMRYRLNRQGMLELDAWLAPLLSAELSDQHMAKAVAMLLEQEPPELQRMMSGELAVPEALRAWLK